MQNTTKTIILARHGRRTGDVLSPHGYNQSRKLGADLYKKFKIYSIGQVIVSPLLRTTQTAMGILEGFQIESGAIRKIATPMELDLLSYALNNPMEIMFEIFGITHDEYPSLVVGHGDILEGMVKKFTKKEIAPLGECEGAIVGYSYGGKENCSLPFFISEIRNS